MARRLSWISNLRKLLLLALLVCIVGVVGLFLFGRAGRQPVRPAPDDDATQADEGTTLIGQDFDYTFTDRERPIFRIRGASVRADRNDTVFLDEVGLTLYDDQGRPYHVESRQASFNRTSNEGNLQGKVFLKGPEGLELRTAQLQLRDKGQTLYAPQPVEIRYADKYVSRGQRLRVFLPEDIYVMAGKVTVDSLPGVETPVALRAQRLIYERKRRLLRVEGQTELRRGPDFLKALRLTAFLSPDEKSLVFVRGLWDVTGQTVAKDDGSGGGGKPATVRFAGKDLAVLMRPEANQVRQVNLEGTPRQPARLESISEGVSRALQSLRLEGILGERGVLSSAQAFGMVVLRETGGAAGAAGAGKTAQRQIRGQNAQAGFRPDGQLATVTMTDNVSYQDGRVSADGERATLNLDSGQGEFLGSPVQMRSDRGQLTGPRLVYQQKEQSVQVLGGVRAVLEQAEDQNLAGSPLGQGEGPVRVEAKEAVWHQTPSSFVFRGEVRAWRGQNLLIAPELRGDNVQNRLTATGGVKSLWIPTAAQAKRAAGTPKAGAAAGGGGGDKRSPVEVTANEMVYVEPKRGEGNGNLTYTGSVRVEQEGKTLSCQQLEAQLGKDNQAETLICTGDAKLNDPQAGRRVEGQRAVYHLADRQVEMFGQPWVTLHDKDGNQLQGRRLLYSIDDGKVQMKGNEPAPGAPAAAPAAPAPAKPVKNGAGPAE
ncbi:MAG TPA: LPS export ABC transporter periplasmic protein LptC [Thermoanaerobaculia bacterium]|nr:LPS export ABC transporter periplasmic protein LptC [Thermoanaerobaculia bacterium]